MTFCVKCGKEATEGDEFCSGCGSRLRSPSEVPPSQNSEPAKSSTSGPIYYAGSQPQIGKRKSNTGRKIFAILIVVAVVMAIAAVRSHSNANSGTNSPSYIAGWNDMAPEGSSSFNSGMPVNSACNYDYTFDGRGFNSANWLEGCEAAGRALNKAINTYSDTSLWKIPVK